MVRLYQQRIDSEKITKPIGTIFTAVVRGQHIVELTTFLSAPQILFYIYFALQYSYIKMANSDSYRLQLLIFFILDAS